jgi:hypothetical protein
MIQLYKEYIYYPLLRLIGKVKNFFFWGWKLRSSHDYDYHYMYEIMYIKLVRMKDYFIEEDIVNWDDTEESRKAWKALSLSIFILDRLLNRSDMFYHEKMHDKHIEKWGEYDITFEKLPDGCFLNTSKRRNVTEENKHIEQAEMREILDIGARMRLRDKQILYRLMLTYGEMWWS